MHRFTIAAVAAVVLSALPASFAWGAETSDDAPLIVEDLQCRGNAAISCDFMLGYVYLERGDQLDETEVRNAQLRLATLRMFDSISIFLEKGSERGKAVIVIEVVETDPLTTEWLIGASYRLGDFRSVTAGRLTHQNLFGAGKLADLSIITIQPLNGRSQEEYTAALRYADPHLLGSTRHFGIVSASYTDYEVSNRYGNFEYATMLRFGATLGRRIGDFSYLTFGYVYRARNDQRTGQWQTDGTFEIEGDPTRHALDLLYGWNSEDDIYFPTHGSSFHTGIGWDFGDGDEEANQLELRLRLQFRKTWALGQGYVSLKLGRGDPNTEIRETFIENLEFTASYARPVAPGDFVRRGRWYVDTGYTIHGNDSAGQPIHEFGLKLGLRLETQALGLIDLYVLGTEDPLR